MRTGKGGPTGPPFLAGLQSSLLALVTSAVSDDSSSPSTCASASRLPSVRRVAAITSTSSAPDSAVKHVNDDSPIKVILAGPERQIPTDWPSRWIRRSSSRGNGVR
jgi:hypothetical protein